jgi:Fe-Mn family superoxide dismutase
MPLSRRSLIAGGAAVASLSLFPRIAVAQTAGGPFKLDPLPYAPNALEPHIDARTMELHHGRHHQLFVTNLNNALKEHSKVAAMPLPEVLAKIGEMPESVRTVLRNSGGGHANHTMFWQVMGPNGGEPDATLTGAIQRDFGGLATLQSRFNEAGGRVFGSGWVFVTVAKDGKLAIESKPNQDSPLMDGKRVLLGNDVWEHAYYLNYQNRRADYLKAWWNTVNWKAVGERYAAAMAGKLDI